jgi:hypothetical protein
LDNPRGSATLTIMPELTLPELESLDAALDLFRASPPPPSELVEQGLHPPLPVCGRHLVWGFAVLAAARAAGKSGLECRLLGDRTPERMLALALRLEARPGAYRWSEKLAMQRYARSRGLDLDELAVLIEGRPDPRLEEKLGQFVALSPALAALVENGGLDLRTAYSVRGLPEEVFPATAPLSFSERRSFLGLLCDARLDREETLAAARQALAGSRPVEALRELASPSLAALRRDWAALEASLLGGSGVTLKPPDFFEGDLFEARFSFRSRQGLSRRLRALARLETRFDELESFLR